MKILEILANNLVSLIMLSAVGFVIYSINKREKQHKFAKKMLKKAIDTKMDEPLTLHPEIDPAKCAGCGTCTRACPEGSILQLINHKAVLVGPTKCVGHGECEAVCPMGAITLVFGTKARGVDIPRLSKNYETNVPGLYIAGELGGMGLIRNAIKQGCLAATHALTHLPSEKTDYDILIVGAGPAGLAAGVTAIATKKSYLCVEQNSFGGTVYNFPRQKIVMSHPFELPIVGKMKFESNKVSKEQLLAYWKNVRKQTGFQIAEQTRFESIEKIGNIFKVKTSKGEHTAKKVVLAMGVRGSPRRLGLPNEDLPKVTYNLLDPEQYRGKQVVVVGGGNAGVEAAQMLAKAEYQNKVHLLVRSDKFDRCNEDNIRRIQALKEKGLVEIWFNSSVKEIQTDSVVVTKAKHSVTLKNDFLFVFAGAEMPYKFLMSLGVAIDKKFGEGLKAG